MAAFGTYLQVSGFWKVTQIEAQLNETDEITSLVEIDRRRKHICIGARNDISINAAQN